MTLALAWWFCLNAIQATRCTAPTPSGVRPCPMPWPSGTALCPHVSVSILIPQALAAHPACANRQVEQVRKHSRCLFSFSFPCHDFYKYLSAIAKSHLFLVLTDRSHKKNEGWTKSSTKCYIHFLHKQHTSWY